VFFSFLGFCLVVVVVVVVVLVTVADTDFCDSISSSESIIQNEVTQPSFLLHQIPGGTGDICVARSSLTGVLPE